MIGRHDDRRGRAMALAGIGQAIALAAALIPQQVLAQTVPVSPMAAPDAAQRITEYLGGGYLTLGEGCARYGWSGVHQIMVRAQPQGRRGNPDDESQMAIYFATGVISMRYDYDRRVQGGTAPITQATYVWNGPWTPEDSAMSITFNARYGDSIDSDEADLRSVYIALNNFNEHPNCQATMRVSLGRI